MNLSTLETFLEQTPIPQIKAKPKTFLGIARQPHYENVMSNIYAFFFDVNEEHRLRDLFITSLTDLIRQQSGDSSFEFTMDFDVLTEIGTNNGGRIDLLIQGREEAIIIENKVHHVLNNDLEDYWKSVKKTKKTGIILSLKPVPNHELQGTNFLNILHCQLVGQVMKNLSGYILEASEKYLIFLKDFFQNTLNLSKPMDQENLKFYLEHQEKINLASSLREAVLQDIKREVANVGGRLSIPLGNYSFGNSGDDKLRHYLSPNNPNLTMTIIFEDLMQPGRRLKIAVKLFNEEIEKCRTLRKESFPEDQQAYILDDFYTNGKKKRSTFAEETLYPSPSEIQDLTSYIVNYIEGSPLLPIFMKVDSHLLSINTKVKAV